jgi:hypothetical protein
MNKLFFLYGIFIIFFSNLIIAEKYVCSVQYETLLNGYNYEKIIEIDRDKDIFNVKITNITSSIKTLKYESSFPLKLIYEDEDIIDLVGPSLEFVARIYKSDNLLKFTSIGGEELKKIKDTNSCIKLN